MDPLKIDIGAEIIDLVKRLGQRHPRPMPRPPTPPIAPVTARLPAIPGDHPDPPKAA
jgi:hypothetical protein